MNRDDFPAFPLVVVHEGMTLRDYFAAKAMQGLLAGSWCSEKKGIIWEEARLDLGLAAKKAYVLADAMLAARQAVCDAK